MREGVLLGAFLPFPEQTPGVWQRQEAIGGALGCPRRAHRVGAGPDKTGGWLQGGLGGAQFKILTWGLRGQEVPLTGTEGWLGCRL